MNLNDAVSTDQLITSLAVKLCFLCGMTGTEECLLERRNKDDYVSGQGDEINDLVIFKFIPVLVDLHTMLAHKPTGAAETNCFTLFALVTQQGLFQHIASGRPIGSVGN